MQKKLTPVLAVLLVIAIVVAAVFGVQKNDVAKKAATLENELAASKKNAETLSAELEQLQAALDTAKSELDASVTKVAELETKVTELTARAETAEADLAKAMTDLESAKAEMETATVKIAELEAKVAELGSEEPVAEGPTSQAFLMYADGSWINQVWNAGEQPEGVKVTEATVTGEGDYTVGLDFTGTAAGKAEGLAFAALGIADGEANFPNWKIRINEIRVNGKAIEVGQGYTSSDDKVVTRMNIYNEWVSELPADARCWNGDEAAAKPVIVNRDDFAAVETIEVDFSWMKLGVDTAYIMFSDANWNLQYWLDGNEYAGVKATNATITGPGEYSVALDFTGSEAGFAAGTAFTALGIKHGENLFPGWFINIKEIRINGEAVEMGKGYTSSDDEIETRMNIMNAWVNDLPKDARSWDGSVEGATAQPVAAEKFAEAKTYEVDFELIPLVDTAFLMFADTNWAAQAWNAGEYAETNSVKVEGPGTYTLKLDFPEALPGFAFLAAGITTGEKTFPGYFMDITEIKVNGEAIEIGKDYTTSDDSVVTRSNIVNTWVGETLPAEARIADGDLTDATPVIATAEALSNVTSLEVTFNYIYGEPPVVNTVQPLTEDEVAELIAKDYNGYVAVQSESYIFRNDWYDETYGLNSENPDYFNRLTGWDAENNAVDYGGVFEDAAITGNGTYTATMTTGDHGFGVDTLLRFFRVTTDIPSALVKEGHVTISDVKVKIGEGKTQDSVVVRTETDYVELVVRDEYNKIEPSFGYLPGPNTKVVFTFTVSGLAD